MFKAYVKALAQDKPLSIKSLQVVTYRAVNRRSPLSLYARPQHQRLRPCLVLSFVMSRRRQDLATNAKTLGVSNSAAAKIIIKARARARTRARTRSRSRLSCPFSAMRPPAVLTAHALARSQQAGAELVPYQKPTELWERNANKPSGR